MNPTVTERQTFIPEVMTADLCNALTAEGYLMPDSWPFPARVVTDQKGWKLEQPGSITNPDHPNWIANHQARFPEPVYVAPDGTKFTKATNGARVVLVRLSKRLTPSFMRVLPGTRRPKWVIADTPKGEIPEHLKAYLIQPGDNKPTKGRKPKVASEVVEQAEMFAVEPEHYSSSSTSTTNGKGTKMRFDYDGMTNTQLVEWVNERQHNWMTRAYQIETRQGIKNFRQRVRAALAEVKPKAERPSAKLTPKRKPVTKSKVKAKAKGKGKVKRSK